MTDVYGVSLPGLGALVLSLSSIFTWATMGVLLPIPRSSCARHRVHPSFANPFHPLLVMMNLTKDLEYTPVRCAVLA